MLDNVFNNNVLIYIYMGISGIGLIFRFILSIAYGRLHNSSLAMGDTDNKLLKHIKKKYETCFNLEMSVYNVDTFVDKSIYQYRLCGILLSTWEKISGQILTIELVSLPIISLWAYVLGCGQDLILYTLAVGALFVALLYLVDKNMNLLYKKNCIKINIIDYLDNYYYDKLQNKNNMTESMGERTKDLIMALSEVAAHKERLYKYDKVQKKDENIFDEKIIEDVLNEFFT